MKDYVICWLFSLFFLLLGIALIGGGLVLCSHAPAVVTNALLGFVLGAFGIGCWKICWDCAKRAIVEMEKSI